MNVEAIRHDARNGASITRKHKEEKNAIRPTGIATMGGMMVQGGCRGSIVLITTSRVSSHSRLGAVVLRIVNTISRLEKQVQDAERVQRVLQTQLNKVVDDVNRMKTSSFLNPCKHARLQQRVENLTKSTIFTNFGNKSSAQRGLNTTDKNDNASPNQRTVPDLRGSNTQSSGVVKKDIQEPSIDRKLSVLSRQRIMKLDDLNTRFDVCQSEFKGLMETLKELLDIAIK